MGLHGDIGFPHFDFLLKDGNRHGFNQSGDNIFSLVADGKIPPEFKRIAGPPGIVRKYNTGARLLRYIAIDHRLNGNGRAPVL